MQKLYSPEGTLIDRTVEAIEGTCGIDTSTIKLGVSGFEFEYDGAGTKVDWNSQVQKRIDGERIYMDVNGLEWTQGALLLLTDEEWDARFGAGASEAAAPMPDPLQELRRRVKAYNATLDGNPDNGYADARPPTGDDYNELLAIVLGGSDG